MARNEAIFSELCQLADRDYFKLTMDLQISNLKDFVH